jgi:outer membrane PBP1 activator LpoA protein
VELTQEERVDLELTRAEMGATPAEIRALIPAVLALPMVERRRLERTEVLWQRLPGQGRMLVSDRYWGARLALALGNEALALQRLPPLLATLPPPEAEDPLLGDALGLYAELLTRERQWSQALLARMARNPLLARQPADRSFNQQAIWQLLAALDDHARQNLASVRMSPPETAGWLDLFQALRHAGTDADAFDAASDAWRIRYPLHSAAAFLPNIRSLTLTRPEPARRLAVLLPLSGALAELGEAILEGITAQYYRERGPQTELTVQDTGGDPERAAQLYQEALQQGVDRIIGPLTREETEAVIQIASWVPTLLLNRPSGALTDPFHALSLSPEEDARAAARRAMSAGWHSALVLIPGDLFGQRVATAFREAFLGNPLQAPAGEERRILQEFIYTAEAVSINEQMGRALAIEDSQARIRQLQRQTRLELSADAQIRPDIDMILIAGSARDLRMVIPHLHYHRAGQLPMLATSHAFEGRLQPMLDSDLGALFFPDAPWLHDALNPFPDWKPLADLTEPSAMDRPGIRLPRFTALGMDALQLAIHLPYFEQAPQRILQGVAGTWYPRPQSGIWSREPAWLQFHNGIPRPAVVAGR